MNRKKLIIVVLLATAVFAGLWAENKKEINHISYFNSDEIELENEEKISLEKLKGHTYRMKDEEGKVKLTYKFNEDFTYSFKIDSFPLKTVVYGVYEVKNEHLTFYQKKTEVSAFGLKIEDEKVNKNEDFYKPSNPEICVYKTGIMLDGDFFKLLK